ncbi:type II secretion system protein [Candidatus Daviesbacteria bacterium]|nr:type II secretion system protein [Candidatus Daviesbacteria bacterium]
MDLPRTNLLTLDYLKHKGFSLVEILVVIAIIGIISGLALSFTGALQKNTRDAQRSSDLSVLQSALQQYYADQNQYPLTLPAVGSAFNGCTGGSCKTYLTRTPGDPNGSSYYYAPFGNIRATDVCSANPCHFYYLCAKMENPPEGSTCRNTNFNYQVTPL